MPHALYFPSIQSTADAKPGEPESRGPIESARTCASVSVWDCSMPAFHIFLITESADRKVCALSVAGMRANANDERSRVDRRILAPGEFLLRAKLNRTNRDGVP